MWFIGLLIGLFLGGAIGDGFGAFAGALLGIIAGSMLKSAISNPNCSPQALDARIHSLEERIGKQGRLIEQLQERLNGFTPSNSEAAERKPAAPISTGETGIASSSSPEVSSKAVAIPSHAQVAATPIEKPSETTVPAQQIRPNSALSQPSQSSVASFLTGLLSGNILAKIGVALLFFGIASALKLAAQYGLFPLEVRLLLCGAAAVAMIAFGWNRAARPEQRMFGLALQGGGFAILYLIIYFMLVSNQMISHATAFLLFIALSVGCVLLAAMEDGLSLAVLGISGAFLAPLLASSGSGEYLILFSYYALLNGFILTVNWFKGWRGLNVCGFAFTFLIGMAWGMQAYHPTHFPNIEAFLILFCLMYSLAPVAFMLFRAPGMKGWTDGTIVFGTPIAAAFSQTVLMRPYEYGLAWSACIAGIYYLLLWRALLRRQEPPMQFMQESHLGIALGLLTLAIPLAFGTQPTSALWAIEGAVLVRLGMNRQRWLMQIAGTLLQGAAGLRFLAAWLDGSIVQSMPIMNSFSIGAFILAAAGLASAQFLRRQSGETTGTTANHMLSSLLVAWGLLWWFGAGATEIHRFAALQDQSALLLCFIAGTILFLEIAGRSLAWSLLRMPALLLTAGMVLVAVRQYERTSHVLEGAMWIALPLALAVHYWILVRHDKEKFDLLPALRHLVTFWLIIAVVSKELEWLSHMFLPGNTLWPLLAWGAIPALFVLLTLAAARRSLWPVAACPGNYLEAGLLPVVIWLALWSIKANFNHSGSGSGLPYVPLLNPFDLVQMLVLFAIFRWAPTFHTDKKRAVFFPRLVYGLGFIWLSALAARLGHHWADVPFTFDALRHSLFVQSALSLLWTSAAIALMITATRQLDRQRWFIGFALLGAVGAKLLFVDLANVGTAAWTASLIGVALLVLAASYFSPTPPKITTDTSLR